MCSRCENLVALSRRFGSQVAELPPFYHKTDLLADKVASVFAALPAGRGRRMLEDALGHGIDSVRGAPPELRDLFREVETVPSGVNWSRIRLGGALHRRTSIMGGLVLACAALPMLYASPGGNKPLVFSGRLKERAQRRLGETARFVFESTRPGRLRPHADGWKITIKVRLMHAQIRRLLWQSGCWSSAAWGAPINQMDLAYTNLAFSVAHLDSLRRVGFNIAPQEAEAFVHLWSYSGYLLGIDRKLLPTSEREGRRLLDVIRQTEPPPDKDSRELAAVLMETAVPGTILPGHSTADWRGRLLGHYCLGLADALTGHRLIDSLGYRIAPWHRAAPWLTRACYTPLEIWRRLVPCGHALAVRFGSWRVQRLLRKNLDARRAAFQMPQHLAANPSETSSHA
jgi:hypothetical protein